MNGSKSSKIRVLLVDDSKLFREVAAKLISHDDRIEVIATAGDPYEARDKIIEYKPDVMVLDIEMPKMNGIRFLEQLIPQFPLPVVICSSTPLNAFAALEAGAVDYVCKPHITSSDELNAFAGELIVRIKSANAATTVRAGSVVYNVMHRNPLKTAKNSRIIAIGGSTGATEAVPRILRGFNADTPPVVVVVHMPENFTAIYAQRLRQQFPELDIMEAKHGEYIHNGSVAIAAGKRHLKVFKDENGYFITSLAGKKVSGHCPSVDVMFESVAACGKKNALAVLLTGMGSDGANGLKMIKDAGGFTVVQDEESCVVYGMPRVALEKGAACKQVQLDSIAETLLRKIKE